MLSRVHVHPDALKDRWVCYIDLLGFTKMVTSEHWISVFANYSKAVDLVSQSNSYADLTKYVWFSDTFIMYTKDNSFESYISIEMMARRFVFLLILASIPLRGSISFGQYYADESQQIYFGKALIEAYEYGESQNWIGLIQCPSAVAKLAQKLDAHHQMNYPCWAIPFKPNTFPKDTILPAYRIGEHAKSKDMNLCLAALRNMKARATDNNVRTKYDNTIQFLEANKLHILDQGENS